jgi:hypothetical protein
MIFVNFASLREILKGLSINGDSGIYEGLYFDSRTIYQNMALLRQPHDF